MTTSTHHVHGSIEKKNSNQVIASGGHVYNYDTQNEQHIESTSKTVKPSSSNRTTVHDVINRTSRTQSLDKLQADFTLMGGYVRMRETTRDWRMKTWYCTLYRSQMYWYVNERDAKSAHRVQKCATIVDAAPSDGQGRFHTYRNAFTIETDHGEVYFCVAPTSEEHRQWIERINEAFARHSLRLQGHRRPLSDLQHLSMDINIPTTCFDCAISFGLRRHSQRRQCESCFQYFCRAHCSNWERTSRSCRIRMCDGCSFRHYMPTFIHTLISQAMQPNQMDSLERCQALEMIIRYDVNFTVLNILCVLKKYIHHPFVFTRAICMLIPLYERNDGAELEEYWIQYLCLLIPLFKYHSPFTLSVQFFLRFIIAICRRSERLAFSTVWNVMALYEDARIAKDREMMSFLLLVVYTVNATTCNPRTKSFLVQKLLQHAPEFQRHTILNVLKEWMCLYEVFGQDQNVPSQWLNARCSHHFQIVRTLIQQTMELSIPIQMNMLDPFRTDTSISMRDQDDLCLDCHVERKDFQTQLAFVDRLTQISDILRQTEPRQEREQVLERLLMEVNTQYLQSSFNCAIRLPIGSAIECHTLRVVNVLVKEGKVFSTRTRAPTMIVLEVCEEIGHPMDFRKVLPPYAQWSSSRSSFIHASSSSLDSSIITRTRSLLAHKDSVMLDRMLCGGGEDHISESSLCSESEEEEETERPQDSWLIEEAQETFVDGVGVASVLASLHSNSSRSDAEMEIAGAGRDAWKQKCERIRQCSPYGKSTGWTLVSLIAKSHDDLRQEVFAMQLMRTLLEIFESNGLNQLFLRPYRIVCTGANVGLIETLTDALSIDALKKRFGSLEKYFKLLESTFPRSHSSSKTITRAFITSMAASSLYCYFFQIKDRHNGNILVDSQGHILHIDFGFMLGIAPGGAFSLEDAPFKLTNEMVELMGGMESQGFQEFTTLFIDGFMAVRREYIKLVSLIHLTAETSLFPCFQNKPAHSILHAFRSRLFLKDGDEMAQEKIHRLIHKSLNHWGTRQYDKFQLRSNGIVP